MDPGPGLTIVLLGNTGVGKSATGNSILGRAAFESRQSFRPVTTEIREERGRVCGRQISVVDTPGILRPGSEQRIRARCRTQLSSSAPRLFLVVVRVRQVTEEVEKAVNLSIEVLGDAGLKNSVLLFTGGDNLNVSLKDYVLRSNRSVLTDMVRKFEDRCLLFNNKTKDKKKQVQQLLKQEEKLRSRELPGPQAAGLDASLMVNRTITLAGLPGGGRSSAANTILGSDRFPSHCGFDSLRTETVCESAAVEGRWVTVRDAPGLTVGDPDQMISQLKSIIFDNDPKHVFMFVFRIGRMSREESVLLQALINRWHRLPYFVPAHRTMILFTHGDQVRGRTIEQLMMSDRQMSELAFLCEGRYGVLDNTQRGNRQQVRELLDKVDQTIAAAAPVEEEENQRRNKTQGWFWMNPEYFRVFIEIMESLEKFSRRVDETLKQLND